MDLTIKPLSPELAADYLDFFDRRDGTLVMRKNLP